MNEEDTHPNIAARYTAAEGKFDTVWSALGASHWTLAAFIAYSVALVAVGFWLGGV